MKSTYLLGFSLLVLAFAACNKTEQDTQKPTIKLIEPANEAQLVVGEEIHLDMELEDNIALKEYKIDIHINDGHTHKKVEGTAWSFQKVWSLEGKRNADIHHHEIVVPAEVAAGKPIATGHYHFGVYVTDAAGNETQQFIEIEIEHPSGK